MTTSVTMDFREEYEAEQTRRLRRRFIWYCSVTLGISALSYLSLVGMVLLGPEVSDAATRRNIYVNAVVGIPQVVAYFGALLWVLNHPLPRPTLIRIVFWLIVGIGLFNIAVMPIVTKFALEQQQSAENQPPEFVQSLLLSFANLSTVFTAHLFAALFIPWTPREALQPLVPLLIANALVTLGFSDADWWVRCAFVAGSPLVGVPGVLIAWWRHSRFRQSFHFRMLRGQYGAMKQELTDARRLHEVLFPPRVEDDLLRFDYRYEPMRQIGGDYIYTALDDSRDGTAPRFTVLLLDVTGHGIGAALTVNRLHGELERLFGERIDISPGDVITALNHYINVALAKHNFYATAICMRVDPGANVIEWSSAGHPPAFVRTAGGLIDRLDPTAMMLGASSDKEFDAFEQSMPFRRGDTVIAYTDGVTESKDQNGAMLKIEGMQMIMAALPPSLGAMAGLADRVLDAIQERRFGAAEDDTLVVEISRTMTEA